MKHPGVICVRALTRRLHKSARSQAAGEHVEAEAARAAESHRRADERPSARFRLTCNCIASYTRNHKNVRFELMPVCQPAAFEVGFEPCSRGEQVPSSQTKASEYHPSQIYLIILEILVFVYCICVCNVQDGAEVAAFFFF